MKTSGSKGFARLVVPFLIFLSLTASCSNKQLHTVELMPAPEVYTDGTVDPFSGLDDPIRAPEFDILYATSRKPDPDGDRFYSNERGFVLRLGRAETEIGPEGYTWKEARDISLLKNRTEKYPVRISGVDEFGILNRTVTVFTPQDLIPENPDAAAEVFAKAVNDKLEISKNKDVYVHVHGYKLVFSNPVLVAAELWHFLGYDGVFVDFAWPSTPSKWASNIRKICYSGIIFFQCVVTQIAVF